MNVEFLRNTNSMAITTYVAIHVPSSYVLYYIHTKHLILLINLDVFHNNLTVVTASSVRFTL